MSAKLKSIGRKHARVQEAMNALSAAQESLNRFAQQSVSTLERELGEATARDSYPGLNFMSLVQALCATGDAAGRTWVPEVLATHGSGPWDESEFDYLLQDLGIEPVDMPHASVNGLIVGTSNWSEEKLEKQIYGRDARSLRIYTQELFVVGLILQSDPYDVLEQAPIDEVGHEHPAIQYILNRDFVWPWVNEPAGEQTGELTEGDFNWAEESVLKKLGYSARSDGPGQQARQRMLTKAFEADELPGIESSDERQRWGPAYSARRLYALSHFLRWLISFQGSDKPDARQKWMGDLDWLKRSFYKRTMAFSWPTVDAPRRVAPQQRSPNTPFMKPLTPSAALAAVVGSEPLPRTEIVSRLWGYIKKNRLQDPVNKRMIHADSKLMPIFGTREISMFEMAGRIGRHVK